MGSSGRTKGKPVSTRQLLQRLAAQNKKRGVRTVADIMRDGTAEERQRLNQMDLDVRERLRLYLESTRNEIDALGLPLTRTADPLRDLCYAGDLIELPNFEDHTSESLLEQVQLWCDRERFKARLIAEALQEAKPKRPGPKPGTSLGKQKARVEELRATDPPTKWNAVVEIMNREFPSKSHPWTFGKVRGLTRDR